MADARALLGQVWEQFRRQGVADDLAIIEHVAAVLLRIRELVPSDRHGPPAQPLNGPAPQEYESSELGQSARSQINRLIREAAGNSPQEAAEVLDPGALFRLPRLASGGQYPTPRHVVQLMHRLCKVDRGHALLDLACGSGGFLAYRAGGPGPVGPTVGVEIAQRWARIAYANALLRIGPAGVTVLNQNAVSAFGPAVQPGTFDRVLMNPPFGETVDADVLGAAAVPDVAGTSEVVLATLALEALAQNGRAGVLFPAGPLFGSGTAETALRRRLLQRHHLRAVIALPKNAFQPFSNIQAYLVIADREPVEHGDTWFFVLTRDGYPAGRSRDLTQPPAAEPSDFPLVRAAMRAGDVGEELALGTQADVLARVTIVPSLVDGAAATEGVVIEVRPEVTLQRVAWHPPAPESPHPDQRGFVLSASLSFGDTERTVMLAPGARAVFSETDPQRWQTERYPEPKDGDGNPVPQDPAELRRLVYDVREQGGVAAGGGTLVVTAEGVLLGRSVRTRDVQDTEDPQPATWVVQARPRVEQASTTDLLRELRDRQHQIERHLEELSDSAGGGVARAGRRPEAFTDPNAYAVYGKLSAAQDRVYRAVLNWKRRFVSEAGEPPYEVVLPFRSADINADLAGAGQGEAELPLGFISDTLAVFEAMGILLRAQIAPSAHRGALSYYRLATPWDEPAAEAAAPAAGEP